MPPSTSRPPLLPRLPAKNIGIVVPSVLQHYHTSILPVVHAYVPQDPVIAAGGYDSFRNRHIDLHCALARFVFFPHFGLVWALPDVASQP